LEKTAKKLVAKVVSTFSSRRKAQLVNLALDHLGEASYYRLAQRGFSPNGIIDIGAYHGEWSRLISRIYPNIPILMIEAQAEKRAQLEAVCIQLPQAKFELCLLGNKEGAEATFNVMEAGSSLYSERSNVPRTRRTLTIHTLDRVIDKYSELRTPLLIKLDVQGAELDVLKGGSHALSMAEVVQLEVALMNYNEGAPDLKDVLKFMAEYGFAFFDICGFIKATPKYLAQIDVMFVRTDSMLRTDQFVF
jgi:FkbM family methyltransferase